MEELEDSKECELIVLNAKFAAGLSKVLRGEFERAHHRQGDIRFRSRDNERRASGLRDLPPLPGVGDRRLRSRFSGIAVGPMQKR